MSLNPERFADDLLSSRGVGMTLPSQQDPELSLDHAYDLAFTVADKQVDAGDVIKGRKIGISNPASWPAMGLDNVVWGYMFARTVHTILHNHTKLPLAGMTAPKAELELVFKLKERPLPIRDPFELLQAVEWFALGFEIVDCPYPDWHFKPTDLVATFGFHAALVVGDCVEPDPVLLEALANQIGAVTAKVNHNGQLAAEGGAAAVVGHPLLALAHLTEVVDAHPSAPALAAGEIISTGTLTPPVALSPGDVLVGEVDGPDLPALTVEFVA
ncbi:MAG: fumarylacetoacetate hydrolase family protein [Deinococcota bacterium]